MRRWVSDSLAGKEMKPTSPKRYPDFSRTHINMDAQQFAPYGKGGSGNFIQEPNDQVILNFHDSALLASSQNELFNVESLNSEPAVDLQDVGELDMIASGQTFKVDHDVLTSIKGSKLEEYVNA